MAEWLKLLAYALHSLFKSRARLEAESLVLRQQLDGKLRDLIRQMSMANPLWGAPRIHSELLMLGIEIAESTVANLSTNSSCSGQRTCTMS
jgi:hypothetical protein